MSYLQSFFSQRHFSSVWELEDNTPGPATQLLHKVQEQKVLQQKATVLQGSDKMDNGNKRQIEVTQEQVTMCASSLGVAISPLPPTGHLPFCINNWTCITNDPWILKVVKRYRLELIVRPHQLIPPGLRPLSEPEQVLVAEEVQKPVEKQAVRKAKPTWSQFLSRLFLVLKKDGFHRSEINLRPLNHFIQKQKFKMEGAKLIQDLLQRNNWMVSIDLKEAYLSVSVAQEDRHLLRFTWENTLYEFQCLLFGLNMLLVYSPNC